MAPFTFSAFISLVPPWPHANFRESSCRLESKLHIKCAGANQSPQHLVIVFLYQKKKRTKTRRLVHYFWHRFVTNLDRKKRKYWIMMADLTLARVKLDKSVGLVYMRDATYAGLAWRSSLTAIRSVHSGRGGVATCRRHDGWLDMTGQKIPKTVKISFGTILNHMDAAFVPTLKISWTVCICS